MKHLLLKNHHNHNCSIILELHITTVKILLWLINVVKLPAEFCLDEISLLTCDVNQSLMFEYFSDMMPVFTTEDTTVFLCVYRMDVIVTPTIFSSSFRCIVVKLIPDISEKKFTDFVKLLILLLFQPKLKVTK